MKIQIFKTITIMLIFSIFIGCASIPEEQKSDTYEVEAYEIYVDSPTSEKYKNQYFYFVYEKDVKLAKKNAEPIFVDKWEERTSPRDRKILKIISNKEDAYKKGIGMEESYLLGTNVRGPKKYRVTLPGEMDFRLREIIKDGMFNVGKNDRFYGIRVVVDCKEKYGDKIFTYDCVDSVGNSKKGKKIHKLYTNDEACFKEFKSLEMRGAKIYTKVLR
jgi:hypothetical protein